MTRLWPSKVDAAAASSFDAAWQEAEAVQLGC